MSTIRTFDRFIQVMCFLVCAVSSCILDKEPDIPTGVNNEEFPVFLSSDIVAITHDSLLTTARLSSLGNLNILRHGWVWSESPGPTLDDNKLDLGALGINSTFETPISGLTLGKNYSLRPFVATGSGEIYGPEKTIFMGFPKLDDIASIADSACFIRVQSSLQSPVPLQDYGIVYLTGTGTPTLQNKNGQVTGSGLNSGNFQTDMTMLHPSMAYSIRAYAKNDYGVGYSKVLVTTTPSSSMLSVNFNINTDAIIFQGAIIQFANTSVSANAYSWDFGDGDTSLQTSPVHTFNVLGTSRVRLTAENEGCLLTKDTILTIIPNPFANYWVAIPGGTFSMGCTAGQEPDCQANEYPFHNVTINPFSIGKTEVTQGQWQAVVGYNPSWFNLCGSNCPVEQVSWTQIVDQFIPALYRKTGRIHRLPTEAEWEYAARGGADTKYSGSDNLNLVGWYSDGVTFGTRPVGQKIANAYGLFDMSGNVWEWCNDWFDANYYTPFPAANPSGPATGTYRVSRGGSYLQPPNWCRVSLRLNTNNPGVFIDLGFRLIRE